MRLNFNKVLCQIGILLIALVLMIGCEPGLDQNMYWKMQDGQRQIGTRYVRTTTVRGNWSFPYVQLIDLGDVDGDGTDDIIWQFRSGQVHYWKIQDSRYQDGEDVSVPVPADWMLVGVGDVNGDRTDDVIWQHRNGQVRYWQMQDGENQGGKNVSVPVSADWTLAGVGDVDDDGTDDIVWQNRNNIIEYGTVNATEFREYKDTTESKGTNTKSNWRIAKGFSEVPLSDANTIRFDAYAFPIPQPFSIFKKQNHIYTAGLLKFNFPVPESDVVMEWEAIVNIDLASGAIVRGEDDGITIDLVVGEQPQSTSFPRGSLYNTGFEWIECGDVLDFDGPSSSNQRPQENVST